MYGKSADLWDAWLEYRVTSETEFMSSWPRLSSLHDLIGKGTGKWSEWRHINVGDITGKLVQFRIQIRVYDPNVKVIVTDGSVIIDAVDRMWSLNDFDVGANKTYVNFDPPFMFDEVAVAVSIDGNPDAEYANVTNKTRLGFDVELFDEHNKHIAGKIDILARGQGRERTVSI